MLEVVEHEDWRRLGERVLERLQLATRDVAEPRAGRDGGEDEPRVRERSEIDEDGAVVLGCSGEREPGLAASARAGEREQADVRPAEQRQDRRELEAAADQGGRRAQRNRVSSACGRERGVLFEDPALERAASAEGSRPRSLSASRASR